jgi:hypothetical protein
LELDFLENMTAYRGPEGRSNIKVGGTHITGFEAVAQARFGATRAAGYARLSMMQWPSAVL